MSGEAHRTRPEDRIPLSQKAAYGTGQLANMVLATSIPNLANFILNIGLGVSPVLVGLAQAIPRIWDAFTDLAVGYWSDNTRSRWGRRKPFMLVGAICVAVCLALMWQLPRGWGEMTYFWFFLGSSLVFYLAYTAFICPFIALGYELTPDYHERTRLMASMNLIGQLGALPMGWVFAITEMDIFSDGVHGARVLAVVLGVLVLALALVPVVFLRDPTRDRYRRQEVTSDRETRPQMTFFRGVFTTFRNRSFLTLCGATLSFFCGMLMVQSLGPYLVIYYVYGGNTQEASVLVGWGSTLWTAASILLIPVIAWISSRIGKRRAFLLCAGCALGGTVLKWFCYQPTIPYLNLLPAPFIALGFGALWTLMSSMMADVCDEDELLTGERREGTYSAVYWWAVKLGMSGAFAISGFLLSLSGFDAALGGAQSTSAIMIMRIFDVAIPAVLIAVSMALVWKYPLTENRAYAIRFELEKKRGVLSASES